MPPSPWRSPRPPRSPPTRGSPAPRAGIRRGRRRSGRFRAWLTRCPYPAAPKSAVPRSPWGGKPAVGTGTRRMAAVRYSLGDRRLRRPAELLAHALGQRAHNEVVGVLDQVAHELIREAPVEHDRVPVALVEVIAGTDRGIAVPQADRQLRLALGAHLERRPVQRAEGEHLAGDLEHGVLGSEREVLDRPGLLEAPRPQLGRIHAPYGFTARAMSFAARRRHESMITENEAQIRTLIERWARAVHAGDMDAVLADH